MSEPRAGMAGSNSRRSHPGAWSFTGGRRPPGWTKTGVLVAVLCWTLGDGASNAPAFSTSETPGQPSPPRSANGAGLSPRGETVLVAPRTQAEAAALKREAVDIAQRLALDYPEEPLAYALLGSAYYNTGQSETAVTQLRKCLSLNPDQADAYEVLARVAYEKGELEETVRLCREALKRGSASPDLRCRLGRALMDLGRAEEAIRELQSAAKLPRPGSEAFYLLGQAQLQAARYADAKSSFQRAVALMPDHTQAFFGLYTTCLRLGLAAEAEPYRRQFVELEAADRRCLVDRNSREDTLSGLPLVRQTVARTLFGAGQVYRVRNQKDKAAELLRKAAVLDGDNSTYRSALEAYYAQSKALAEGLAVFEQMAAEQPENSLNQLFVGRMRARMRQLDAAERAFLKVQEMAPAQPEGYRALAELYIRAGVKPVAAVASARRAVELEPSGVHYFTLSVACLGNKDRQGAIKAIQRAVDLDPKDAEYRDLLRQLQSEP